MKITRLLALALGLEIDYFERSGVMDSPMAYIRLLHYSGEAFNRPFFYTQMVTDSLSQMSVKTLNPKP
jgi:isopenicillin N synthase-like dioxygenase